MFGFTHNASLPTPGAVGLILEVMEMPAWLTSCLALDASFLHGGAQKLVKTGVFR
jgi:hypothetical protein